MMTKHDRTDECNGHLIIIINVVVRTAPLPFHIAPRAANKAHEGKGVGVGVMNALCNSHAIDHHNMALMEMLVAFIRVCFLCVYVHSDIKGVLIVEARL